MLEGFGTWLSLYYNRGIPQILLQSGATPFQVLDSNGSGMETLSLTFIGLPR